MAIALLGIPSLRAEEGDRSGAMEAGAECLFPFGVRSRKAPSAKVAKAVSAGLQWLAAHQAPGGLWEVARLDWCNGKRTGKELEGRGKGIYDPGITGMVVCAFLASGETHTRGANAPALAKALAALVGLQDPDGCIGPRTSQHFIYNHAFGALALVEAYGETGDSRLLGPARKALAFSALARNPSGAWRYGVKPGDNDTSIAGCMTVPFLAAQRVNQVAEAAGQEPPLPFDRAVFKGVRAWVDQMTDSDYGRTGYIQKGGCPARPQELIDEFPGDLSEASTGIGVYLRALVPGGNPDEDALLLQRGSGLLTRCLPAWTPGAGNIDLYYWYYGSLAMDAVGGASATTWRKALVTALLTGQRKDTDVCAYAGSWDANTPWGPDGGRMYTTAMAVLSLRTPFRYPKLPPDRSDLVDVLTDKRADPAETLNVLRGLALHRPANAGRALLPHASSTDPRIRAAAARALARCEPSAEAAEALGTLLRDTARDARREAAEGLALLGKRASPAGEAILAALADDDAQVRRHALRALGGLPDASSSLDRVRVRLKDPDARVRVAAAALLRRLQPSDAEAETILLSALETKDDATRAEAAAGLGESETLSDAAKQALEDGLDDASPRVQVAAARGLVGAGADRAALLEIMEPCLESKDLETRRLALQLAERLGPEAAPVAELISAAALGGATSVRVAALRALAAMGAGVKGAVAVLYAVRDAGPMPVRDAAREGIDGLGASPEAVVAALLPSLGSSWREVADGARVGLAEQGESAVEPLRALLQRGNIAERVAALRTLTAVGPKAAGAIPDAEKIIDGGDSSTVTAEAVRFLGAMCRRARCAIPRLVVLAEASPPEVRKAAIHALASIGTKERKAIEALGKVASSRKKADRAARIEALRALTTLGPLAEPALAALRLALSSNDASVRAAAVQALAAVGKPAVPHLIDALEDRDQDYVRAAMEALGAMGPDAKKAVSALAKILPRRARMGDWGAARALAGIGKPSVRALVKLVKEGNGGTRHQAVWALGRIGKDAKSAASTLRRARKDSQENVRKAAEEALELIQGK